jgi:tRNA(Ile)-lysidine synthase
VRQRVLPVLEAELGPGVAAALARTAGQLREDADALDELAAAVQAAAATSDGGLLVEPLREQPAAVRRRALRRTALAAGCPGGELFAVHVEEMDALLTRWHGQAGVDLPGPVRLVRDGGTLRFLPGAVAP